jgi:hypothetical protein
MFASLIHTVGAFFSAMSFSQVILGLFSLALVAGLLMFFRPLLSGIMRALVLTVRPRLTREELAARRQLHDARMLQR